MACAAFGISQVRLLGIYLVPFALIPIVVVTFLDSRTALYTHLITILICSFVAPFPLEFLFLQTVIGMAAIDNLRDLVKRSQLMQCALLVFFVYCVSYLGYTLLIEGDLSKINWNMFLYLGINCISLLFAYLLIYILEKLFGFMLFFIGIGMIIGMLIAENVVLVVSAGVFLLLGYHLFCH